MTLPASAPSLLNRHVLVVEDDYILAQEIKDELERLGAEVLGPVPSVSDALMLLAADPAPDTAVLDLNLGGEMVFPLADALHARGIPYVFATAYAPPELPRIYAQMPHCEKPINVRQIAEALAKELERPAAV